MRAVAVAGRLTDWAVVRVCAPENAAVKVGPRSFAGPFAHLPGLLTRTPVKPLLPLSDRSRVSPSA